MGLIKCKDCGHEISPSVEKCPNCVRPIKKYSCLMCLFLFILLLVIFIIPCTKVLYKSIHSSDPYKDSSDYNVTMDGYDSGANITVQEINIWKDYKDRMQGVVATVKHGEIVKFINRDGNGVFIETSSRKKGWVTYYFIKELK